MADTKTLSEKERRELESIYGAVDDKINAATGYAAGVGVGNIARLSEATAGRGGFSDSGAPSNPSLARASTPAYVGGAAGDYINRLSDSMAAQSAQALRQKYDSLNRALDLSAAEIAPKYYDARNQMAAQNAQRMRNFAETASAAGMGAGAYAQGNIARESVYQGNLGGLSRDEAKAHSELAAKRYELSAGLEGDLEQARLSGESERVKALLEQHRLDEQSAYKQARDDASDAKWREELDYKRSRDELSDARYESEWDYKLKQAAAKGVKSAKSSGAGSKSALKPQLPDEENTKAIAVAKQAEFDSGFLEEDELAKYKTPASRRPFANATQADAYEQAAGLWDRFYETGFDAFKQTVDYLKSARASRAVIQAVFDRLPGYAGLNAWYYAIHYGGLDREYYA